MNIRLIFIGLAMAAALCAMPRTTRAQIFITNARNGTIGEYTTSGATINPALVSGLNSPTDIAVSGENLFVTNLDTGTVGEYTTSGTTVNPALVSGLTNPRGIAVSGGNLFVVNVNGSLNTIGEYTTSGATVNPALVSVPTTYFLVDLAVSGGNLFVTNNGFGWIGEYTTSGATVNAALVSGLNQPIGIAVVTGSVPDASLTWTLLLLGLTATFGLKLVLRKPA
jgi:pectin methylesterase-like acyl-CoA thioesterase